MDLCTFRHCADGSFAGGNEVRRGIGKSEHILPVLFGQAVDAVIQNKIQDARAESISGTGRFNDAAQLTGRNKHRSVLAIERIAPVRARGHIHNLNIRILTMQDRGTLTQIFFAGQKTQFVIRDLQNITLAKSPGDCRFGLLQIVPQRRAEIRVKGYPYIDVLFICPALEVRRVAENTKHLFVLATYMDTLRPGRGCADILPEGLKAAGAVGVMINHCEKPMSLPQMKKTIDRARELDFLVFACADTLDEAKAIAQLHPDIINPEPSEIIGGGKGSSPMAYVRDSIKVIKEIDPNIMVEQAAGITCGQEVYDFIMAGSEAAGAASGIMNAADPIAMIDEMIAATRRAADDLKKQEG